MSPLLGQRGLNHPPSAREVQADPGGILGHPKGQIFRSGALRQLFLALLTKFFPKRCPKWHSWPIKGPILPRRFAPGRTRLPDRLGGVSPPPTLLSRWTTVGSEQTATTPALDSSHWTSVQTGTTNVNSKEE